MGTSVCAYHIRACSQAKCLKALAATRSPRAYVSIETDQWVTVVDENSDAFRLKSLEQTVSKISKYLDSDIIITAVYDDDDSLYVAFNAGTEVDRYSSSGDGFDWIKRRKFPGSPKSLAETFTWWRGQNRLESALKKEFNLESSRLKQIVRAFGIADSRAFVSFADLNTPLPPELVASFSSEAEMAMLIGDRRYVEFKW
jgi:hypothetical protein